MSIVAIDIGGTFTDLASLDPETGALKFSKSLTTPPNFEQGARDCLELAGIDAGTIGILRHGTTVVINALLERKGAATALVTTEGFRDILEIGRGNRPEGFNLFYERLPPVVPRELRFDLPERMDARGTVLKPVDQEALAELADKIRALGVDAIAICFLHAWRNPAHEIEVGAYLRKHTDCFVSCSHEISREMREFERTTTTALNAYVGPTVERYVARFDSAYGMLFADFRYDITRTIVGLLNTMDLGRMAADFAAMEGEGAGKLKQLSLPITSIGFTRYAEMRYRRQEYTIKVRLPQTGGIPDAATLRQMFEDVYGRRYGHTTRSMEVEVVMLRLVVDGRTARPELGVKSVHGEAAPGQRPIWYRATGTVQATVWQRATLAPGARIAGPGVVEEEASTTVLGPTDTAVIDDIGNIIITLGSEA